MPQIFKRSEGSGPAGTTTSQCGRLLQKIAVIVMLLSTLGLTACGSDGNSDDSPNVPLPQVSPSGGTIELPGKASVTFRPGSFVTSQAVEVSATSSPETETDFNLTADIFDAATRLSYEIRVNTGDAAPATEVEVVLTVPDDFLNSIPQNSEIQVFAQIFQDGGEEVLDSFDLFPSIFDPLVKTIRVTLPVEAFSNRRRADDTFEAIVTLAATPSKQKALTKSLGNVGDLVWSVQSEILASATECQGSVLGPPLERSLTRTGQFNGTTHKGLDYDTADSGDLVLAVADGTILKIGLDERDLPKPDPRSGKTIKGWGQYVKLRLSDGSTIVYGHLKKGSPRAVGLEEGEPITKGSFIGEADNSGGSSGSHLHIEYILGGKTYIDPEPCVTGTEPIQGGTFSGPFSGAGDFTISVPESDDICTFHVSYTGTIDLTLNVETDGAFNGSVHTLGDWDAAVVSGPSSSCESAVGSFDKVDQIAGTAPNVLWTTSFDPATGAFSGALNESSITGTMVITNEGFSGSLSIPIVLSRQ